MSLLEKKISCQTQLFLCFFIQLIKLLLRSVVKLRLCENVGNGTYYLVKLVPGRCNENKTKLIFIHKFIKSPRI